MPSLFLRCGRGPWRAWLALHFHTSPRSILRAFLRASPRLTPSSRRVNAASQLYDIFLITLRSLQVENNDSNKPIPTRLKNLDKDDDENLPPLRMQLESTTKALASMLQSSARCVEQSALLQYCEHAQQVQTVNEVRDNALPVMCEVP